MQIRSLLQTVSRARAGLRCVGIGIVNGWNRGLLDEHWRALEAVADPDDWKQLMTFPEFASDVRIVPADVTTAALDAYFQSRADTHKHKGERQRFLALVDAFGRICQAAGLDPGPLPQRAWGTYRYRIAPGNWPDGVRHDVVAAAQQLADARLPWSAPHVTTTQRIAEQLWRLLSAYCHATDTPPDDVASLDVLREGRAWRAAIAWIKVRADENFSEQAYADIRLICAWFDEVLAVDDATLDHVAGVRSTYRPEFALEMPVDRQRLLRCFLDPGNATTLRQLPASAMASAACMPQRSRQARLDAAIALELGLAFGMWPQAVVGCILRADTDGPAVNAPAEIVVEAQTGRMTIHIAKSRRGDERAFEIAGQTLRILTAFIAARHGPRAGPVPLLPGRINPVRRAAALSHAVAALIAAPFPGARITARHLPALSALLIMAHPTGTRELARRLLGYSIRRIDRLLDTYERWIKEARTDALLRTPTEGL